MAMTEDLTTLAESWTARELADKLADDTLGDDAFVLRVVAARIAQRAGQATDPAFLVKDLGSAVASIAQAVRTVIGQEDLVRDDPREEAAIASTPEFLEAAAGNLHAMHNWL